MNINILTKLASVAAKLRNAPRKAILARAIIVLPQLALGPALALHGTSVATALTISGVFSLSIGYYEDFTKLK